MGWGEWEWGRMRLERKRKRKISQLLCYGWDGLDPLPGPGSHKDQARRQADLRLPRWRLGIHDLEPCMQSET